MNKESTGSQSTIDLMAMATFDGNMPNNIHYLQNSVLNNANSF